MVSQQPCIKPERQAKIVDNKRETNLASFVVGDQFGKLVDQLESMCPRGVLLCHGAFTGRVYGYIYENEGFDEQRNKNSFIVRIAHVVQKATKSGGDGG